MFLTVFCSAHTLIGSVPHTYTYTHSRLHSRNFISGRIQALQLPMRRCDCNIRFSVGCTIHHFGINDGHAAEGQPRGVGAIRGQRLGELRSSVHDLFVLSRIYFLRWYCVFVVCVHS